LAVLELDVEAGLKFNFLEVFAVKFLVEDCLVEELTNLVYGALQYPKLFMCRPEYRVPLKILWLSVGLLHRLNQKVLLRLIFIVLNLTHNQNLDDLSPVIVVSSLLIRVEETISPKNFKGISIAIKKLHYAFRHFILLRPPVYHRVTLIDILASMFQHMIVEKVLNRPHKRTVVLHLRLY
jgi:hypothetical protein